MKTQELTKEQVEVINQIEDKGFKKDEKNSGFETEQDGTLFYTFFAQDNMGVQMIQLDGSSEGNLL